MLKNCNKLKCTNIVISEEFSEEERSERKVLVHPMKTARNNNKKAYIVGSKLCVKKYTYQQLVICGNL